MKTVHKTIEISTGKNFSLCDITPEITRLIIDAGIKSGIVCITSQHTTTAITLNENESRLLQDIERFFLQLAPADARYLHNDIQLRDCPQDEPENAHAHLIAMMLGQSESLGIVDGVIQLGQWQSLMLVELDGPRTRKVAVNIIGEQI